MQSKAYHTRPSELLRVEDSYLAFCFDEAVMMWGMFVENELDKIEGKTSGEIERKRTRRLQVLMGEGDKPGQFADPAAMFKK